MVRMAVIDATYEPELLRPTEVLRILKVSKTWLYDAAKDGRIACVRLGAPDGPLRFERAVIEALIRDSRLGDHNRE
jgi:predicted site-specific integrase-resolvase